MVFCGKPSKACERCRARRLKCDLQSGTCGQCVRASMPCIGYRDTQQLRIRIETQAVARKASRNAPPFGPQSLPLSIDLQAREAFFAHYVTSRCWNFLKPIYHSIESPQYLRLAIEAVSLAYLWHQVNSDTALRMARKKYISALHRGKQTLRCPNAATQRTTLMASLLLDLFEKITDSKPRNKSWSSHINGALALVEARGLDQFQDPSDLNILVRVSTNYIISCVATDSPVPAMINTIQAYIETQLDAQGPVLRLSNLIIQYANLCNEIREGGLSEDQVIAFTMDLDAQTRALSLDLPPSWQPSATQATCKSDRAFSLQTYIYSNPKVCQAWNILRVIRICLNERVIKYCLMSPTNTAHLALMEGAHGNIETLASEICSCVPQYVDCNGAARQKLRVSILDGSAAGAGHSHTPDHQLDCSSLIFPLYVAGRSQAVPDMKRWVIKTLQYIGSHFFVRNAEAVAHILERDDNVSPWEVYAMLGGYALIS